MISVAVVICQKLQRGDRSYGEVPEAAAKSQKLRRGAGDAANFLIIDFLQNSIRLRLHSENSFFSKAASPPLISHFLRPIVSTSIPFPYLTVISLLPRKCFPLVPTHYPPTYLLVSFSCAPPSFAYLLTLPLNDIQWHSHH